MRPEDDDDEGPSTPRTSGSYQVFRDESAYVAKLLDRVVLVLSKRIDLYDEAAITKARQLSSGLKVISKRFARWPELDAATVAKERDELVSELKVLLRRSLVILENAPTVGVLGRVRWPRRPDGR